MMRRYDAVLFDAGETLVRPEPSFPGLLAMLLRKHGVEVDSEDEGPIWSALGVAFEEIGDRGEPFSLSRDVSKRFWSKVYRAVLIGMGVTDERLETVPPLMYEEFTDPSHYRMFPDALPALRELKAHGYRLGLVSNWEAWLTVVLDRLGITPLFESIVVSGIAGVEKPDPRIFKIALEEMGVEPGRAVYVGDNPTVDVAPAIAMGMGAVLVDRRRRFPDLPSVASLEQLLAVIR